jgi:hypothetical protein
MFCFKTGEAMTIWWIKLTALCFLCDFIPFESILSTTSLLKGVCAISGACVFALYYTFTFVYNAHNSPNLAEQIYISKNLGDVMPYYLYIIRDNAAHFALTSLIIMSWYKYVTLSGGLLAFLFHRTWSIINSNFTTIYLEGTDVYKVKKTPQWAWQLIYVLEMTVIITSTALSIYLQ